MRESLKREEIVRGRRLIAAILRSDKRVTGGTLILRLRHQPPDNQATLPPRRVAIHLSARIKGAVVRNRLKRWLREIYRRNKDWFAPGFDYLIQVKPDAVRLNFHQLKQELQNLARATYTPSSNSTESRTSTPPLIGASNIPSPNPSSPPSTGGNKGEGVTLTDASYQTKPFVPKPRSGNAQNAA